jgi:hypothetical protein
MLQWPYNMSKLCSEFVFEDQEYQNNCHYKLLLAAGDNLRAGISSTET